MILETLKEYIDPALFVIVPMLWGIKMLLGKFKLKRKIKTFVLYFISCFMVAMYILSTKTIFDRQYIFYCIFAVITQGSILYFCSNIIYQKFIGKHGNQDFDKQYSSK